MEDTNVPPEASNFGVIAADLRRVADLFDKVADVELCERPYVHLNIQPHGTDEQIIERTDAVGLALFDRSGAVQKMVSGNYHYAVEGAVGAVTVHLYDRLRADDAETTQPVGRVPMPTGAMVGPVASTELVTDAEPVTVYFSFGHGQTDPDTGKDLLDHYVTVVGPSYTACREAMCASRYGNRWAFDYLAGSALAEIWIPRWIEHERIVLGCSAECDALCVAGAPTGEARGWHHDDCPWVPVLDAREQARRDDDES